MNDFVWTENLVKEFLTHRDSKRRLWEDFENFKQSKQQSKNNQDWEILSIAKENDVTVNKSMFEYYLKNGWQINQVKVLSSGEIFSVNDITNHGRITGFHFIDDNTMFADFENNLRYCRLNELKKSKPILFTTEDNVAIYEGDEYWFVDADKPKAVYFNSAHKRAGSGDAKCTYKYFSTEQAAKEYVIYNKPLLSLNDVLNNWKERNAGVGFTEGLKNLVKQKINQ